MTDPLALDPVLPPAERLRLPHNDEALSHDERFAAFEAHVTGGGKVEASDWMPDEYRTGVLRFVEMHANSELMGVLPGARVDPPGADPPTQAGPDGQGPGRGRPRAAPLSSGGGPRQVA